MSQLQYKLETPFKPPQKKKQARRSIIDDYNDLLNTSFAGPPPRVRNYYSYSSPSTLFYDAMTRYYTDYGQRWGEETR